MTDVIKHLCDLGGHLCLFRGSSSYGDGGELRWETVGRFFKLEYDYSGSLVIWHSKDESNVHPCQIVIGSDAVLSSASGFTGVIVCGRWSLYVGPVANSERGKFTNLVGGDTVKHIRVPKVSKGESALTCDKCGRVMKSTSGKTLHETKCQGDKEGNS